MRHERRILLRPGVEIIRCQGSPELARLGPDRRALGPARPSEFVDVGMVWLEVDRVRPVFTHVASKLRPTPARASAFSVAMSFGFGRAFVKIVPEARSPPSATPPHASA